MESDASMILSEKTIKNQKSLHDKDKRIYALRKLMIYYKEITETVREPFIILDNMLRVVTANKAFYLTFKVLKKDTEGKQIYKLGNNQWDAPGLKDLLEHILPKHRVMSGYEISHSFPYLGHKVMLLNARQVDNKQLILLAIEDVTLQRKLKKDSEEMTENLTRQRDLLQGLNDTKDEFVSMASHQLRTPATVVKQYVSMISEGYAGDLNKAQKVMLDVAYKNNERQLEIIEDLLRVAKIDGGKVSLEKSSCDVVSQVRQAILGQAILFEKRGQTVVINIVHKKVFALIDPKLMLMVIENLLDNAGKYSPNDSTVTITISQKDNNTNISFMDTGVGIRKTDINKLFKKFSRINNKISDESRGTGLGLYWVKKIVGLHGGSVDVISKINKGSTFTINIPVAVA
jgi:two-component system CheB/CheR fusion protein